MNISPPKLRNEKFDDDNDNTDDDDDDNNNNNNNNNVISRLRIGVFIRLLLPCVCVGYKG